VNKFLALSLFAALALGCNSGDVPTENVPTTNTVSQGQQAPTNPGQPQNMSQAIEGNPNLPPAAKNALMGKGK